MKAYRSTLAAIGTRAADRQGVYRARPRGAAAAGAAGPLVDVGVRTVPFAAVAALADRIGVTVEDVLTLVGIPARTASRRRAASFLKPDEADRLLRVARVMEEAARVLGGHARAGAWLLAPHPLLGGEPPFALLDSDAGAKSVSDELVRIDLGDFA